MDGRQITLKLIFTQKFRLTQLCHKQLFCPFDRLSDFRIVYLSGNYSNVYVCGYFLVFQHGNSYVGKTRCVKHSTNGWAVAAFQRLSNTNPETHRPTGVFPPRKPVKKKTRQKTARFLRGDPPTHRWTRRSSLLPPGVGLLPLQTSPPPPLVSLINSERAHDQFHGAGATTPPVRRRPAPLQSQIWCGSYRSPHLRSGRGDSTVLGYFRE